MEPKERYRAGLLILLGGILANMYRGYAFDLAGARAGLFLWLFSAAMYFFLRSAYYLMRSYHGHTSKTLALAQDLEVYRRQLSQWHLEFGEGEATAEEEYRRYVQDALATAADHNASVNSAKSEYLFRANTALIYCGVLVGLSFLPYAYREQSLPEPVYKVQLVTPDSGNSGR
jgi:hypothetical protein